MNEDPVLVDDNKVEVDRHGRSSGQYGDEIPSNLYLANQELVNDQRFGSLEALAHDEDIYIIQFNGPVHEEWTYELEDFGLTILAYLPDFAFITRGDPVQLLVESSVAQKISWVGEHKPVYKIDSELLDLMFENSLEPDAPDVEVNVKVFDQPGYFTDVEDALISQGITEYRSEFESQFLTTLLNYETITPLLSMPEVEWIEKVYDQITFMDNIRNFTGADLLELKGYNGTGLVAEVKDDGFDLTHPDFVGQVKATDGNPSAQNHGTCTFGIVFGTGKNSANARGMLPGAQGIACSWNVARITSVRNLVNNWGGLFQSNSWGSSSMTSSYSTNSRNNDRAVFDYNITVLYAAGNSNFQVAQKTMTDDSTAKNVISVGGVNHYNNKNRNDDKWTNGGAGNTPSQGPSSDGRIKPDICGPFDSTYTTDQVGSAGYSSGNYYSNFGGTSGATPITAGGVGLIYQLYADDHFNNDAENRTPAASTVKALLIANAYQYNLSKAKRIQQGWGMVDIKQIYDTAGDHFIVNETTALKTGQDATYSVYPIGTQPLKITLAWTDYWGTTSASKHLINDLNLNVTDPNGKKYFGNFGLNTSLYSPASSTWKRDGLNNVENVFIENPVMGEWKIEVSGYNVVQDADIRTPGTDQAFALVASGVKQDWHEHDLAVTHIDAPDYAVPDSVVDINATIYNFGMKDEYNINVNLTVKGTTINATTIGILKNLTGTDIEFQWFPPLGVHDVCVDITPVAGENRTTNNNWTKIVIAEPDVRVYDLVLPDYGVLNAEHEVQATVENPSMIPLSQVNVTLSVNGTAVNWTDIVLPAETNTQVLFNWKPLVNGSREITITALPHVNESIVDDNSVNGTVLVTPYRPLRVFVLDSWGTDNPDTWDTIGSNWRDYGGRPIIMNSTGFMDKEVVYSDLVNVSADVLVISAAYLSFWDWEFSDSEISAIKKYTEEGHGLVVTSITFYTWAENNYKLAPLVGINDDASRSFGTATDGDVIDTYFSSHPLFYKVNSTRSPGYAYTTLPADNFWDDMDMGAGALVAGNNATGRSAVIDNHGIYYISNWLEFAPAAMDYQFLYNAINSSKYEKYNIDVSVRNLSGPDTVVPFGEITAYNVSVHNIGNQVLNNVNVTLYVNNTLINHSVIASLPVGTYVNVSLGWLPDILGRFSAHINVSQQPGETYIYDNIRRHSGSVRPNPEISTTPVDFLIELNETETVHRILRIDNTGFNELIYSLSADVGWISLNLTNGTVPIGKYQLINITVTAGSMLKGHYFGNVTIYSNDIDEPASIVPVHMIVYGQLRYIKLTPENGTTHTDLAVQFVPTGYNMTHGVVPDPSLTWETTDPAGIISSTGLYSPGTPGNWTIYCNETGGAVSNFSNIKVDPSPLDHIDIDPTSWAGTADETKQFTATGRDASNGAVLFTPIWTTTDPWGTVTNGLYRPGMEGTWQVFASNFRASVSVAASVDISPGALTWIDIDPSTWSGKSAESVQFTATGYDAHDNVAPFTQSWSTTDPKGTVSNTGFYNAGTNGTWQIKCENIGQTISKSVFVNVVPGDLDSIRIVPGLVNITADDSYQFNAVGLDLNDNELPINATWSISGGGSINNDTGLFVADDVGDWFVFAFYLGNTDQAVVNITYGQLANIQVSPQNAELKPDEEQKYTAYGYDADFNSRPVAPTWDVSGGGLINPVSGIFTARWSGTWKVYANDSGVSGFTNVIVTAGDLSLIVVKPQGPEVTAGDYINFDAEGRDSEGNPLPIQPTWDVDGGGKINPSSGQFQAEIAGIWTVTARVGQFKGSTSITINPGALDRIVVDPSYLEISADDTKQFNATGYDGFSNKVEVSVEWSVSGGGVINPTGLFTPKTTGRWIVAANYMNLTGAATVVVLPGKAAKIIVTPAEPTVTIGDRTKFYANITDSHGNIIDDFPKWSVNSTAGEIYVDGVFFAKTPGSWNITAKFDSVTGTTKVDVTLGLDTDSDGMNDKWEFDNSLDPLNGNDAFENRDDDSLSNLQEFQNGTDPFDEDSDSDGMDDYWEAFFGLDPTDPGDASMDYDLDGFTNQEEYDALTDPNDPESHPIIKEPSTGEAGFDRDLLWIIILIVIIVVAIFIIGAFIYYRRRPDDRDKKVPGKPPEVVDVQYEFDEETDDYIDFEDRKVPPPPPPRPPPPPPAIIDVDYVPGKKRKEVKRKRGKEKPAKKAKKVEAELVEDDISWDDDHRYGRDEEDTEIEWDDEDGKPYSKAKKKYDDEIDWEE